MQGTKSWLKIFTARYAKASQLKVITGEIIIYKMTETCVYFQCSIPRVNSNVNHLLNIKLFAGHLNNKDMEINTSFHIRSNNIDEEKLTYRVSQLKCCSFPNCRRWTLKLLDWKILKCSALESYTAKTKFFPSQSENNDWKIGVNQFSIFFFDLKIGCRSFQSIPPEFSRVISSRTCTRTPRIWAK